MPDPSNQSGAGEDFYSDSTPNASSDAQPKQEGEEKEDGHTEILPKSICPEQMKPGDEFKLKVVRVHDDQYEVEYVPEQGAETEAPSAPQEGGGQSAGGGIASLME